MKVEKINNRQLFSLMAIFTAGTSLLVVAANLTSLAKQDAWIATIVTTVLGLLFIWMYVYLGNLYPDKTYVEIIRSLLGKWIGGLFIADFLFLCFITVPQLIAYNNYFIKTHFLPETPAIAINTIIVTALAAALFYGIEVIARAAEFFIIFISILFLLTMLLVSPNINFDNLFPVLEKGVLPVVKGSFYLSSFITWSMVIANMIFFRKTSNNKIAKKSIIKGYLWGAFLVFLANIMSILVLGSNISSISQYPTFLLAKEINIGEVLTRLEGIVAGVWLITLFFKTILYFYGFIIGLSQLIGLKDHRKVVIPFCLLILVLSLVVYPNNVYMTNWDTTAWVPYMFVFGVILPIILLIVHAIKKRRRENTGTKKTELS